MPYTRFDYNSLDDLTTCRFDAVNDNLLVDIQSDVMNTFYGSLLVDLTWGDPFSPLAVRHSGASVSRYLSGPVRL